MAPEFTGFIGPSNQQASHVSDAERTVNLYARRVDAGTPKAQYNLYRRPGLRYFASLGSGPVTALFAQDGRAFGVSGNAFGEIHPGHSVTIHGAVQPSPVAATISSNGEQGQQLFITSGGLGYIFNLEDNTLTQITDDAFPSNVAMGLFFDSAFLALDGDTGAFFVSSLYDGLEWNALDQGIQSQTSDKIIAFQRMHDNLALFGSRNTAIWVNTGTQGAAGFAPQPGTIIEHGILAPLSCVEVDNTAYYLGQDPQGAKQVWRLDGYTPARVSTHAVEFALSSVSGQNAVAWAYQEQGHTFYVLYVPGLPTTWVYDLSTQQWHERGHWDTRYGRYVPYRGVNHCFAFGKHLVGDRLSGSIYEQDMAFFSDRVAA